MHLGIVTSLMKTLMDENQELVFMYSVNHKLTLLLLFKLLCIKC